MPELALLSFDDYQMMLGGSHAEYYIGRWEYYKKVIDLIRRLEVSNVLELGPGFLPIVPSSDVMLSPEDDKYGRPDGVEGRVIIQDATIKSWPIPDKHYDLFIALQVWEHLDNKQQRAFREVRRISKRAILSFPYRWSGGDQSSLHRAHRDIDKELIGDWTLNTTPVEIVEIPRTGPEFSKGERLIYYWEF